MTRIAIIATIVFLLAAAPAQASGGVSVPEPGNMALFALGILGVVLGRMGARKRRRDDD